MTWRHYQFSAGYCSVLPFVWCHAICHLPAGQPFWNWLQQVPEQRHLIDILMCDCSFFNVVYGWAGMFVHHLLLPFIIPYSEKNSRGLMFAIWPNSRILAPMIIIICIRHNKMAATKHRSGFSFVGDNRLWQELSFETGPGALGGNTSAWHVWIYR